MIDPQTGAGAYMIAGGGNGGKLPILAGAGLGAAGVASMFLLGSLVATPFGLVVGVLLIAAIFTAITMYNLEIWSSEQDGCFWTGIGVGSGAVGAIIGFLEVLAANTLVAGNLMPAAINKIQALFKSILAFTTTMFGLGSLAASSNTPQSCWKQ